VRLICMDTFCSLQPARNEETWSNPSFRIHRYKMTRAKISIQDPILRLLNLLLQFQRCSRLQNALGYPWRC
jgi:hypothetical protein